MIVLTVIVLGLYWISEEDIMSKITPNLKYNHLFVVCRFDVYLLEAILEGMSEDSSYDPFPDFRYALRLLKVFTNEDEAIAEVERLTKLEKTLSARRKKDGKTHGQKIYFYKITRITRGIIKDLDPFYDNWDFDLGLTKRIIRTRGLNRPLHGPIATCIYQALKKETSESIISPKIAFCSVTTEQNNKNPFGSVSLVYIGSDPTADGVLITFGEDSCVLSLSYWSKTTRVNLVCYRAECNLSFETISSLTNCQRATITLTKEGKKISDDYELILTINQWEGMETKQLMYPWPGEICSIPYELYLFIQTEKDKPLYTE